MNERPETLAALADGRISPEQADVVLDAIDRLPGDPDTRDHGEQVLLEQAARLTATELQRRARGVVEVIDPDGAEREREAQLDRADRVAHRRRFFSITDDGAGGIRVKGRGSVEDGATLRAALLPLTAPAPTVDPETCEQVPDPRDYGVRMWDALVAVGADLARREPAHRTRTVLARGSPSPQTSTRCAGCWPSVDTPRMASSSPRRSCDGCACDADIIPVALGGTGVGARRGALLPAGDNSDLDSTRRPRPTLRVSGLPAPTDHVPRPSHRPLGIRWRHQAGQPGAPVRAPPSDDPSDALGGATGRRLPPSGVLSAGRAHRDRLDQGTSTTRMRVVGSPYAR